jgi:undecaprenyl-diphosphatase
VSPRVRLPPAAARRVSDFDTAVDEAVGRLLRDRRAVDRIMYAASAVGDHGLVWMGLAGAQALWRHEPDRQRRLLRALVGLGVESLVVNGPIKWVFRRERPVQRAPRPLHLRQPRSSSFPSGHASSAFFGAALLRDDDPLWPLYYLAALVVASSRVHVRIHHASDVLGGALVGIALGELARAAVPVGERRQARDGISPPPATLQTP